MIGLVYIISPCGSEPIYPILSNNRQPIPIVPTKPLQSRQDSFEVILIITHVHFDNIRADSSGTEELVMVDHAPPGQLDVQGTLVLELHAPQHRDGRSSSVFAHHELKEVPGGGPKQVNQ